MSVDERALAHDETAARHRPAHARSTDTVAIVAVLVASVAMVAALGGVGFAARAVNPGDARLQQVKAAAGPVVTTPAPATPAASTAGTVVGAAVPAGSAAAAAGPV